MTHKKSIQFVRSCFGYIVWNNWTNRPTSSAYIPTMPIMLWVRLRKCSRDRRRLHPSPAQLKRWSKQTSGRAAWSKRMQRAQKFCLVVEIFGIHILQAVPAASVSRLEKLTIGKLMEVRDGGLHMEEVRRIQLRISQIRALRASIFNID
ncbi:hypothetical protein P389DRAFT_25035 [Cystobasidium minutum MCA 4210]|uniref:uncharacterized protein n=1 Tax=Cystobasidium minutum MCA 4210 TaxID=1397322 RepID=UPI0034CF25A7|eukprot:jgi/Rhomi1/25035/CE25034_8659